MVLADQPFGQWNKFRILMVGSRVTVWLNDKLVVDHALMENYYDRKTPIPAKGPIELQTHGGEIRWRNVFLREISPDEANKFLRSHTSIGFESIFNGNDFAGWAGNVDNYEVKDGSIVCKPGKGGTLYTKEELAIYPRLDFKLPPGGNNGLAIRYSGQGNAAYDGMCELQVLDNDADQYKKLDPGNITARLTGWLLPSAATCVRRACGIIRKSRSKARPSRWN